MSQIEQDPVYRPLWVFGAQFLIWLGAGAVMIGFFYVSLSRFAEANDEIAKLKVTATAAEKKIGEAESAVKSSSDDIKKLKTTFETELKTQKDTLKEVSEASGEIRRGLKDLE